MKQGFLRMQDIQRADWGRVVFSPVEDGRALVHLCLASVADYWRTHGIYQRSPRVTSYTHDLPFDGDPQRLRSLMELIKRGGSLPPVEVGLGAGGLSFPDGRHRIVLLHVAGYTSIPASVAREHAADVIGLCGASAPDPRIEVALAAVLDEGADFSPSM